MGNHEHIIGVECLSDVTVSGVLVSFLVIFYSARGGRCGTPLPLGRARDITPLYTGGR